MGYLRESRLVLQTSILAGGALGLAGIYAGCQLVHAAPSSIELLSFRAHSGSVGVTVIVVSLVSTSLLIGWITSMLRHVGTR